MGVLATRLQAKDWFMANILQIEDESSEQRRIGGSEGGNAVGGVTGDELLEEHEKFRARLEEEMEADAALLVNEQQIAESKIEQA